MSERSIAIEASQTIDGWLNRAEAECLYDLAKRANGPIIEIGSWRGRSTSALAMGSQAGNRQDVYAVDSFEGVPPTDRPTDLANVQPGRESSSPELLRANLDAVGVNGLVKIVPKQSASALADIPAECGLLFVDGDHDYEAITADLALYLPRVKDRGFVVCHDCSPCDAGVELAVQEQLVAQPHIWRHVKRVNSAVVFQRRRTEQRKVFLAAPGKTFLWASVEGYMMATSGVHDVTVHNANSGWDDMNMLWVQALNMALEGKVTHFAMLHSDIAPAAGWIDVLLDELDDRDADLVSSCVPLKDHRGVTSSGIGNPENPWGPFRRFTMRELMEMPETFSIKDTEHPDKFLLHNTGCWVADLRKPVFQTVDTEGFLVAIMTFPTAVLRKPDGRFQHLRESEDWYFSRKLHEIGAKTFASRKIRLNHIGDTPFGNYKPWGTYKDGDEDTKVFWKPNSGANGES